MENLNKIIEEAWRHRNNPEMLLKKFQEVFEDYRGDAVYLLEYASALDSIGKETEVIPMYKMAIKLGLSGKMKTQAEIQLGSALSVTGENKSAVDILRRTVMETGDPATIASLCIALFRSGEIKMSLKTALNFILSVNQGLLPEYKKGLSQYIDKIC